MFNFILKVKTLQERIFRGFLLMGLLTLLVALIGFFNNKQLAERLHDYSNNAFPSINSLWRMGEAQTQMQSALRLLINSTASPEDKQTALEQNKNASKQYEEGRGEYEKAYSDPEEKQLYAQYKILWDDWKAKEERFMELYGQLVQVNLSNPPKVMITELLANRKNSPQYLKAIQALNITDKMLDYRRNVLLPSYDKSHSALLGLIKYNQDTGNNAGKEAKKIINNAYLWMISALILTPILAILLGKYLGKSLTHEVQKSCIAITTSSNQIGASGKELEATVAEQNASTNQVSATSREIAATSRQLAQTMDNLAQLSQRTAQEAGDSQEELQQMQGIMVDLSEATSSIVAKLGTMSNKANNINSVVETITKVAVQTNLLSLNAAIEAEKAGEYGAGFSVVAREIRRLADQTAVATLEIEQMVKEMQMSVSTGVMEMDKFNHAVNESVGKVEFISGQISKVINQVQGLTPSFIEVSQGMHEQSQGAEQINEAMEQLSQAGHQTVDAIRETNLALVNLDDASIALRNKISRSRN